MSSSLLIQTFFCDNLRAIISSSHMTWENNFRLEEIKDQGSEIVHTVAGSPWGILATTITMNPYMKWSSVFWKLKIVVVLILSPVSIFLFFSWKLPCKQPEFHWHFPQCLCSWYHPLFAWSNFAEFIHSIERRSNPLFRRVLWPLNRISCRSGKGCDYSGTYWGRAGGIKGTFWPNQIKFSEVVVIPTPNTTSPTLEQSQDRFIGSFEWPYAMFACDLPTCNCTPWLPYTLWRSIRWEIR